MEKKHDSTTCDIIRRELSRHYPNQQFIVDQYDLATYYGYDEVLDDKVDEELPSIIILGDVHYDDLHINSVIDWSNFPKDTFGLILYFYDCDHYFLDPKRELTREEKNERKAKLKAKLKTL